MAAVGPPQLELWGVFMFFFSSVRSQTPDLQPTFMNKHVAQTPSPSTELFTLERDIV